MSLLTDALKRPERPGMVLEPMPEVVVNQQKGEDVRLPDDSPISQAETDRCRKADAGSGTWNVGRYRSSSGRLPSVLAASVLTAAATIGGLNLWLAWQSAPPPGSIQAACSHRLPEEPTPTYQETIPPTSADVEKPLPPRSEQKSPTRAAKVEVRPASGTAPPQKPAPETPSTPVTDSPSPSVRRSEYAIAIHPGTAAGYAAMANGNLEAARIHYQESLGTNRRDRDALLGIAVAAQREGRLDEAVRSYGQVLALNPRDGDANAGIALLRGNLDPVAFESRLKAILAEQADNAALHHAHGALLARQNRWGEAQEAFFRAVILAPHAADYQFNLAVSLDHLGLYGQARKFYRKALNQENAGSGTFNREAVEARIAAIEALGP